jgi:hypothetical protein
MNGTAIPSDPRSTQLMNSTAASMAMIHPGEDTRLLVFRVPFTRHFLRFAWLRASSVSDAMFYKPHAASITRLPSSRGLDDRPSALAPLPISGQLAMTQVPEAQSFSFNPESEEAVVAPLADALQPFYAIPGTS